MIRVGRVPEQGAGMVEGFRVDLTALTNASEGVKETIVSTNRKPVSDLDPPAETFGHDRLATTVTDFCDRWNQGVTHLTEDVKEISGRLDQCVQDYRQTEEAAHAHLHIEHARRRHFLSTHLHRT